MQRIIGITGLKQSGKDTVAEYLQENYNYRIFRFADPIKEMIISLLFHMNFSPNEIKLYVEQKKEITIPGLESSYRQLAQGIGTSWGREMINRNVWVNILNQVSFKYDKVVISDIRFNNEAAWIKNKNENNIIIKIIRNRIVIDNHISESGINEQYIDKIIINDGKLSSLYHNIDLIEGL